MEVRTGSNNGPVVEAPAEVGKDIGVQLRLQQESWLQKLKKDPTCFGDVEVAVHAAFQQMADQMVAGLLGQIAQGPELADQVKKNSKR